MAKLSWKSPWTALAHDLISIPVAWFLAYWLRFNLDTIPQDILHHSILMLPWVMIPQATAFWYFGLYRGVWRFASLPDLVRIVKAVVVGGLFSILALFFLFRLQHMPRAIFPLYGIFLFASLGGSRLFYRWFKDKNVSFSHRYERVLIVGAGAAGEGLCRDLLRKQAPYLPVAFVDDKAKNIGREIHGIRVVGHCLDIQEISRKYDVDVIMIALPSANAKEMRRIHAICESTNLPVHTLPGINDLVSGRVSIKNLRKISLEDLLGRDPIALDKQAITQHIQTKRVLVSGGAGSIGSELCRQIMKFSPSELIVVDNNEYHLFLIEQEFSKLKASFSIHFKLVDISDDKGLYEVFETYQPEVVFHAAAFKHVPLLQSQPRAAVRNNVLGTLKIAKLSVRFDVHKFILVSTDKAVNPTSFMGASKRAAELVCQSLVGHKTQFITVRFGNVLGSRGSVVETFQKQLEHGGPLTITHPEMTRFFMTTKEACQLILQALTIGEGGELFVLDMGEPVKIRYMAEQMIRLAGKKINEDIQLEYVGLREGEKLYEELFYKKEQLKPTAHAKILSARHKAVGADNLRLLLENIEFACDEQGEDILLKSLMALVPEYFDENQMKQEFIQKDMEQLELV